VGGRRVLGCSRVSAHFGRNFGKLYDNLNIQTNCVALSIKLLPFLGLLPFRVRPAELLAH